MTQLILIPGLLCDATVWQPFLEKIDNKASVADLTSQDDLTKMAKDCLNLHAGSLEVAGHSMGARVAIEMARLAPERIQRMALLDTGIHPLREGEREKREAVVKFAYDKGMEALADKWLAGMVYEPNQQNSTLMQNLRDMVLQCDTDLHARQIQALTNRPDASRHLAGVKCPVLLVVGRQDQWSPVSQHEDMLDLLPDARLEIIDNAGHFAPLEQGKIVAELLFDFFTGEQQ